MKHFFIDSENVGDFWIPLLNLPAEEADLIVFYTKNSPHMSYESLIKLKESDRTVTFVKCYEGTNALDFQLCSELGYRLCENKGDEFIIVTNDTGYDAAVKYWRHRKYPVKRITGKESKIYDKMRPQRPPVPEERVSTPAKATSGLRTVPDDIAEELLQDAVTEVAAEVIVGNEIRAEEIIPEENAGEVSVTEDSPEEMIPDEAADRESTAEPVGDMDFAEDEPVYTAAEPEEAAEDAEEASDPVPVPEEEEPVEEDELFEEEDLPVFAEEPPVPDLEELTVIVNCIGMDNLAELHNQLIQFYGESGKSFYQSIKSGSLALVPQDWDKSEKFLFYCALIIRHSDFEEELRTEQSISALAEFLCSAESKRRNLNSLRYALLKKFGKDLGRRYYFLLKPYVKAMNQM